MFAADLQAKLVVYTKFCPFDTVMELKRSITWERRDVEIKGSKGEVIFSQKNVEVPSFWSMNATTIVASKYFRGHGEQREASVWDLAHRVCEGISNAGLVHGYFDTVSSDALYLDLMYVVLNQMAAFNSPVWFNVGAEEKPQCSACFILDVQDDMKSILNWYAEEGMVFRGGSGAGINISKLREDGAPLSKAGYASGPLSFALTADRSAGSIKSGGRTRRAAKMLVMDVDHPDIEKFIQTKVEGEAIAQALIAAGFDPAFNAPGGAYELAPWQNANNSVRVSNAFMQAVVDDGPWELRSRLGPVAKTVKARDIWSQIVRAAWQCGDPGLQFDDTINSWHTCPHVDRIYASNPCCFVGDVRVDTSEGKIAIGELAAMDARGEALPHAFSWDRDERMPVLKPIRKAWVAGHTKQLVEVRTERGLTIRCTPDHRWMVYGGAYVEAQDLKPGQRFRKINRDINDERSFRRSIMHRVRDWSPNGMSIQARFMWEQVNGPIPEGFDVHHLNEDPTDDRLSNLALVSVRDHHVEHSTGENNPRFIDVSPVKLVEVWEALAKKQAVTPGRWNKYVNDNGLKGLVPLALSKGGGRIRGQTWAEFSAWIADQQAIANDRVLSVEHITLAEPVPVYDIEVADTHNFGIYDPTLDTTHSVVVSNSEYMFLNNTACNLASINAEKVPPGSETFRNVGSMLTLAMDIIVELSGYPTTNIEREAKKYRTLGLGYANIGAYLMRRGVPYDSEQGRAIASQVTSDLTALTYLASIEIARVKGSFENYDRANMHAILAKHAKHNQASPHWHDVGVAHANYGCMRNAQASVIAPTGTIGFMMDVDTTGIEPSLGLVTYKKLVGGGTIKLVNESVPTALLTLGYKPEAVQAILEYIEKHDTIEGAPGLLPEHLPVFDCSLQPANGKRFIEPMGHVRMLAAVQPFVSGAISKTINTPNSATEEEIGELYMASWRMGLKAVAIYRDGCKQSQPLNVKKEPTAAVIVATAPRDPRRKLPKTRQSVTHKFTISGMDGYLTVGLFEDGQPGEIFVTMNKQGSTISGLMDAWAQSISIGWQYGVPLDKTIEKLRHQQFAPAGFTGDRDIPHASSITDYIAQWLQHHFRSQPETPYVGVLDGDVSLTPAGDAPLCTTCGSLTVRAGACHRCTNCGATTGCG